MSDDKKPPAPSVIPKAPSSSANVSSRPPPPMPIGRHGSMPPPRHPASLHDALKEAQALGGGAVSRPPPPSVVPTGRKMVLLVDDDARTRGELAKGLSEFYDVHEAADGVAAAEACTILNPALIVCDVVMPRLDGFSFAKVVRSNPRLAKVPLVFLTSRQSPTDVMQGLSLGARAYIPKPFSTPDVVGKIRKMLG